MISYFTQISLEDPGSQLFPFLRYSMVEVINHDLLSDWHFFSLMDL